MHIHTSKDPTSGDMLSLRKRENAFSGVIKRRQKPNQAIGRFTNWRTPILDAVGVVSTLSDYFVV